MRIILFTLATLISSLSFSQGTTQEEYNFMTKGYQQLLESGLDMKKGYALVDTVAFTVQDGKYEIIFMNLLRQKNKSLAGTIAIVTSKVWGRKYYLGIPAAQVDGAINHQGTLMVQISNYSWDANIKTGFLQALSEYLSLLFTKNYTSKV